jgi:hypothetical protein
MDATELLNKLSADEIRKRLDDLDNEQRALRVLLRSLLARRRAEARRCSQEPPSQKAVSRGR